MAAVVALAGDSGRDDNEVTRSTRATTSVPTVELTPTSVVLGSLLPEPTGIVLVAVNEIGAAARVDLDTGTITLPPARLTGPHFVLAVGGSIVTAGSGAVKVYSPDLVAPGEEIAEGDVIYRSSTPGRLWVLDQGGESHGLFEVALDGAVTAGPFRLPEGAMVHAVSSSKAVITVGGDWFLYDPKVGTGDRLEGEVLAVHGPTVARFHCRADLTCALRIGSVRDIGPEVRFPGDLRPDAWRGGARFSPDGGTLAAYVPARGAPSYSSGEVVFVDVATREVVASVPTSAPFPLAWADSGEWAFVRGQRQALVAVHVSGSPIVEIPLDALTPQRIVAIPVGGR